jgi:hypothetical protein
LSSNSKTYAFQKLCSSPNSPPPPQKEKKEIVIQMLGWSPNSKLILCPQTPKNLCTLSLNPKNQAKSSMDIEELKNISLKNLSQNNKHLLSLIWKQIMVQFVTQLNFEKNLQSPKFCKAQK